MAPTTAQKAAAKPYDRPKSSKSKGKGKAPANELGAPATHGQSSRKGKKAWRKNIDITHEEEALEQGREEERLTGGKLATKTNDQLFMVDTEGDMQVASKAKRQHKPLRSLAVLSERSAIPALAARTTPSLKTKKASILPHSEKERLRRIARRPAASTPATTDGVVSSADIRRASAPAASDVWGEEEEVEQVVAVGGFGEETIVKRKVKAPITIQRQREIHVAEHAGKGLEIPAGGVSYNPAAAAHAALIEAAVAEEMATLAREKEEAERLEKYGAVVAARREQGPSEYAEGMVVGEGETDSENEESDGEDKPALVKKPSKRKTTAQRNRALRQKLAEQVLRAEKEKRKLANSVTSVAEFKKEIERRAREQAEKEAAAKLARKEKERLQKKVGEKIGKHRVQGKRVEVQLGEDLAESLRQIKPEGNLFKDRFLALQKRSLIEPRVPQQPKKRTTKYREYEKHPYKRFV
ncbi:hypothetical protein IAT38_005012 [Cryptococcus sp. DSM 104549]